MANEFFSGSTIYFRHTVTGGAEVALGIKSHNIDMTSLLHDVTNNKHGGYTARIGGKRDARGSVSGSLDLDEQPHAAGFSIYNGQTGVMKFGISNTKFVTLPFIVEKLHYESSVESEVKYSFDVQMNVLAGDFALPTQGAA